MLVPVPATLQCEHPHHNRAVTTNLFDVRPELPATAGPSLPIEAFLSAHTAARALLEKSLMSSRLQQRVALHN